LPASTQWELIGPPRNTQLTYDPDRRRRARPLLHTMNPHAHPNVRQEIDAAVASRSAPASSPPASSPRRPTPDCSILHRPEACRENLNQLLQRRAAGLDQPMQMCDALSRNEPRSSTRAVSLSAARTAPVRGRGRELPGGMSQVIESLREVYRFEALTQEQKLSDLDRLAFHQAHSQPVMNDLQKWIAGANRAKEGRTQLGSGEASNTCSSDGRP